MKQEMYHSFYAQIEQRNDRLIPSAFSLQPSYCLSTTIQYKLQYFPRTKLANITALQICCNYWTQDLSSKFNILATLFPPTKFAVNKYLFASCCIVSLLLACFRRMPKRWCGADVELPLHQLSNWAYGSIIPPALSINIVTVCDTLLLHCWTVRQRSEIQVWCPCPKQL